MPRHTCRKSIRGATTVEYIVVTGALVLALGVGFGPDSVFAEFIAGMSEGWRRFVYAMSTPF